MYGWYLPPRATTYSNLFMNFAHSELEGQNAASITRNFTHDELEEQNAASITTIHCIQRAGRAECSQNRKETFSPDINLNGKQ